MHVETHIGAAPERIWDAARDVGALHTRLVPGFVTDTRMEGDTRVVTFASGTVARERIVGVDDTARRVAWAIGHAPFDYHHGALQVYPDGDGTRVVWTADVLPEALAQQIKPLMEAGLAVMKRTFEQAAR
ncbi:MAG TPA: SRPBCC family protein [Telluria sp.]|nr:SRPBCC family protein [Telluria sp.]